jgi:glycosyltransferase involved in cell wall biosynthesis
MDRIRIPVAPISIVIPAHNAEPSLEEAIVSVSSQTLRASEIIVIADACSDHTSEIATALGVKVIEIHRRNISAALNIGVQAATQPWIAFLDADDLWKPEKLAAQWRATEAFPTAGLVSCDYDQSNDAGGEPVWARSLASSDHLVSKQSGSFCFIGKVTGDLLSRLNLTTICAMVRREVFDRVGLFNEDFVFGQTQEFFARALARYPFAFVEEPLAVHRRHDYNHTKDLEGYRSSYVAIITEMLRHPERYPVGAGEAYRRKFKDQFHQFERALLRARKALN